VLATNIAQTEIISHDKYNIRPIDCPETGRDKEIVKDERDKNFHVLWKNRL
jgi:hypothetical protein